MFHGHDVTDHLLSMLSVRNPCWETIKRWIPFILRVLQAKTRLRTHERVHRNARRGLNSLRFLHSTDLWTLWALIRCMNIKRSRRKAHALQNATLFWRPWGSMRKWKTRSHGNGKRRATHSNGNCSTLQSHLWSRPGELLRSRLISLVLLQVSQRHPRARSASKAQRANT